MDSQELQPIPAVAAPTATTTAAHKSVLWPAAGFPTHLAVIVVLGAIILFTYANTLHNMGFALDNKFLILEDPRLREVNWSNTKLILTTDYWWPKAVSGLYRPLTTLSYQLNYAVFNNTDHSLGYHLVNYLLHWTNAVLVYFLVLVLMGNIWPAFFVAALFAVHPIATESVTNIIGRADLFAALFMLAGFLCYAKSATLDGWRKLPLLIALMVFTTLGVFCKESAVVIAGVIVLYDFTFRLTQKHPNWLVNLARNFWEFFIKGYVALIPPLLAMGCVRLRVFENMRPPELPWVDNPLAMPGVDFWSARMTAIKVLGKYLWLMVWPQTLSCDYSYNQIPLVNWHFGNWEDAKALIALIVVLASLVAALISYRRNKPAFFFVLFFFLTVLPTANLFRIIGSIMAERFMYVPAIGFIGGLVVAVYTLCRRTVGRLDISPYVQRVMLQTAARSLLLAVGIGYGARTFFRNYDWEDDATLWSQAALACPNSFKTHKSLAFAWYENLSPQDLDFQKKLDRIIAEGEKSLAITDQAQIVMLHLGHYYRLKGDNLAKRTAEGNLIATPESQQWYQKSVNVLLRAVPLDRAYNDDNRRKELLRGRRPEQVADVGNHEIYWNLGISYMRLAQYQSALNAYAYMRHLAPTNPDAYLSIASVCLAVGQLQDAAVALLQTLLLDNNRQEALRRLAEVYKQIDTQNCAVVYPPGQTLPKLNMDCALVASQMCVAYFNLTQVFVEAKQLELARLTKANALGSYPCNPEPFNKLLPDSPTASAGPVVPVAPVKPAAPATPATPAPPPS